MWMIASLVHRRRQREGHDDRPQIHVVNNIRRASRNSRTAQEPTEPSMPLLYSLARNWAWEAVCHRCQTHPEELAAVDSLGESALHWAVFGRPPVAVVKALLEAKPDMASIRNSKGFLPLHIACSYRAGAAVLEILLEAYPESAGEPANHSYPLHILCDFGCDEECLAVVLRYPAALATLYKRDGTFHQTPLSMFNARKNLSHFDRTSSNLRQARTRQRSILKARENFLDEQDSVLESLQEVCHSHRNHSWWRKAAMLTVASVLDRPLRETDLEPANILRACVVSPTCPTSLRFYAILLYQEELETPDEDGNLPLHLAAARQHGPDNVSLLWELVTAVPSAAKHRNSLGQLPLTVALESNPKAGWKQGIQALVQAHPKSLQDLNLTDPLYAFVWGRLSHDPNHLFLSIRCDPDRPWRLLSRHNASECELLP